MRSGRCDKCNALLPLDGGACLDCSRNLARIEKTKISPRKRAAEQLRTGEFEPSHPRVKKSRKLSKTSKMLTTLVTGAIALGGLVNWFSNQDFSPTPPPPPVVRTNSNGHCEKPPKIEEGLYWAGFCNGDLQGFLIANGGFEMSLDEDAPPALRNVSATQDFYNLVCESIDFNRQSEYEIEITPSNEKILISACKVGIAEGYRIEHKRLVADNAPIVQTPKPKTRGTKPRPSVKMPVEICTTTIRQNPYYNPNQRLADIIEGGEAPQPPTLTEKTCYKPR
jgi:hypothetical protein